MHWETVIIAGIIIFVLWAMASIAVAAPEDPCRLCGGWGDVVTEDNECSFRTARCPICGGTGRMPK